MFFWYRSSRASTGLSKHGSPCYRRFADFQGACARGGRGTTGCIAHVTSWMMRKPRAPSRCLYIHLWCLHVLGLSVAHVLLHSVGIVRQCFGATHRKNNKLGLKVNHSHVQRPHLGQPPPPPRASRFVRPSRGPSARSPPPPPSAARSTIGTAGGWVACLVLIVFIFCMRYV